MCGLTDGSPEYSAAATREEPPTKRRVVFDEVTVENPQVGKIVGYEAILDPRGRIKNCLALVYVLVEKVGK